MSKRPALTLSELLVILVVFALLIAVVLPSITGMRLGSSRTNCSGNLKDQWAGMKAFADANGGRLPTFPTIKTGASLHDQPALFTAAISAAAATPLTQKQFYCPELGLDPTAISIGWTGVGGFRALGYAYLNDRTGNAVAAGGLVKSHAMNPDVALPSRSAQPDLSFHRTLNGDPRAELAFDLIVTSSVTSTAFTPVIAGAVPAFGGETSSNIRDNIPDGQNVLRVDGGVQWHYFKSWPNDYSVIGPGGIAGNPVYWWLHNP